MSQWVEQAQVKLQLSQPASQPQLPSVQFLPVAWQTTDAGLIGENEKNERPRQQQRRQQQQ